MPAFASQLRRLPELGEFGYPAAATLQRSSSACEFSRPPKHFSIKKMNDVSKPTAIRGDEHWTAKDGNVKLFLYGLPNPHKHFAVMPGISHASFQQKNYALVYYILWSFFAQFAPLYRG